MKMLDPKAAKASLIPAFVVGSCLLQACLVVGVAISLSYSLSQKPPTLVELADGSTVRVKPIDSNDRDPEAIRSFTGTTLRQLFDWRCPTATNTQQPPVECGVDVGLGTDTKLTLNSWQAGFALAENFRQPYLREIAKLTPSSVYSSGQGTQAILLVKHIGQPQKLSPGQWKVPVVSNLVIFDNGNNLGKAISVNKDVFVRSVDTPPLRPNPSALDQTIYNARRDGLEIYAMQDLNLGNR
jgi:hypothetical protein